MLLPFLVSRSQTNELKNVAPYTQIALAGHTLAAGQTGYGEWCECGTENCICDAGETPENHPTSPFEQQGNPDDPKNPSQGDPDPGPLTLLVVLALLVWRFGR